MQSERFGLSVIVTRHAAQRMAERHITGAQLLEVIDTGQTRYSDATHLWAYKHHP